MRTLKIALLATVATAALSSATFAADLIISEPVIENTFAPSFDWEGPYVGLFIAGQSVGGFGLGANLGVNVLFDSSFLGGIEGEIEWLSNGTWQGQADARLGFVADPAVIYALLGVGTNSLSGLYVPAGVGVEFAVADNLSLKAEYEYHWDVTDDAAIVGDESAHVAKVGLNWHF
jgi:opacity protein-like surface antigen